MTEAVDSRFVAAREAIHGVCFAPTREDARQVGVEVELLVCDAATRQPVRLLGGDRCLIALLRRHAAERGWAETEAHGGVPRFVVGREAIISFEPGGQVEISTVACNSASSAAAVARTIALTLRARLADEGIDLASRGIDPVNDAANIPLQLPHERYRQMTEYLERISPFGIRMMRQTAAIQVSIDRGPRPAERWRLLNDLVPYVIAIFANSRRYLGADSGHQSYRAHCWRMLDPRRTGIVSAGGDPAGEYARFALNAPDMTRRNGEDAYAAFADWPRDGTTDARWATHLTTLFPEVRPRGHFEVRSCDAIDPAWYVVPIVFLCGLAYDEHAAREAAVLAADSRSLLRLGGRRGLGDSAIARTARDLFQLALAGARRLGDGYVNQDDRAVAEQYYAEYTGRDRAPADDAYGASRREPSGMPVREASLPPA